MSVDRRRERIECDSAHCNEATRLPIESRGPASSATGWMFVTGTYDERHYCPECAGRMLPRPAFRAAAA